MRKFNFIKSFGKKNIVLAAVSLLLVALTAVGATASWIEDVSQVEFSSTDGQETPLRVGSKALKANVVTKSGIEAPARVNLEDYFYESGDMHLSPCYSDGETFKFPYDSYTLGSSDYRTGTKDDANVNYLSATFKVKSEGANAAFWFEKSSGADYVTFKKAGSGSSAVTDATLQQLLRISVTVDGVTNVYAFNSTGAYKTDASTNGTGGRRMDQYTYYSETFNNNSPEGYYKNSVNITNKPNQGAGNNLDGNTLFSVAKGTAKTVTVKLWLEYDASAYAAKDLNIASVNINLVSAWAKTRRIYVKDSTVHESGFSGANWLSASSSKLYFGIKDDLANSHWQLTRVGSTQYYYVDIPAVYNNTETVFFRTTSSGWNNGSKTYSGGNVNINCSNYWETTFPDTFHSEVYTVYSTDFATWEPAENVHCVYFVNSAYFSKVCDYMWDHNSEINQTDINAKVVKNANWPGLEMTTKMAKKTSSQSLDTYAFFYNSDYDRIIFNDGDYHSGVNQEYQTQDLWLTDSNNQPLNLVDGTFDMTTLTWFHTNPSKSDWNSKMPTYTSNTFVHGNFSTNNVWKDTRFAYGGEYVNTNGNAFKDTNANNMVCKVYVKTTGSSDYQFMIYYNGTAYKTWDDDGNLNLYAGNYVDMYPEGGNNDSNVICKSLTKGVYRIYLQPIANNGIRVSLAAGEANTY